LKGRILSAAAGLMSPVATCKVAEDTPLGEYDSESSDLAIASKVLRTVAKQYSGTKKLLFAQKISPFYKIEGQPTVL